MSKVIKIKEQLSNLLESIKIILKLSKKSIINY